MNDRIHEQEDSSIYKLFDARNIVSSVSTRFIKFGGKRLSVVTFAETEACKNSGNYLCFYVTNELLTLRSWFDNNGIADRV